MIRIKRAYSEPSPRDGMRILVDRVMKTRYIMKNSS